MAACRGFLCLFVQQRLLQALYDNVRTYTFLRHAAGSACMLAARSIEEFLPGLAVPSNQEGWAEDGKPERGCVTNSRRWTHVFPTAAADEPLDGLWHVSLVQPLDGLRHWPVSLVQTVSEDSQTDCLCRKWHAASLRICIIETISPSSCPPDRKQNSPSPPK